MKTEQLVDVTSDTRSDLEEEIQFSRWLTGLCLLFCIGGLSLLFWAVTLSDDVRLASPASRDLERIASRMLGFESRLPELSSFEQVMYRLGDKTGKRWIKSNSGMNKGWMINPYHWINCIWAWSMAKPG